MEQVTLSMDEYFELVECKRFLECLGAAGVDNWDGYEEAIDMFEQEGDLN